MIVGLAENLDLVALIGVGRHRSHQSRFCSNCRFIRCDQFSASCAHLLNRLFEVVDAGIENPEDLTTLRPFLLSGEMIPFPDNAESILDPAGPGVWEIYTMVEELTRFNNIGLGITSRTPAVPPHCKRPAIRTLPTESAYDIFYGIGGRSGIINNPVRHWIFTRSQSHFSLRSHLTTYGIMSDWPRSGRPNRRVLRTDYNENLTTTIEPSFASRTFRKLTPSPFLTPHEPGPSARELPKVIAFFYKALTTRTSNGRFPSFLTERTSRTSSAPSP